MQYVNPEYLFLDFQQNYGSACKTMSCVRSIFKPPYGSCNFRWTSKREQQGPSPEIFIFLEYSPIIPH